MQAKHEMKSLHQNVILDNLRLLSNCNHVIKLRLESLSFFQLQSLLGLLDYNYNYITSIHVEHS
jgi:hypothetical protein